MANLFHENLQKIKKSPFPFIISMLIFCLVATAKGYKNTHDDHRNNNLNPSGPVPSHFSKFTSSSSSSPSSTSTSAVVCNDNTIPYKSACEFLVSSLRGNKSSPISVPKELFDHYVHFSFNHANNFLGLSNSSQIASAYKSMPNSDCTELLEDSLDQLSNVINRKKKLSYSKSDVQTWLSAALTNQQTCIDSLQNGAFHTEKGEMISKARKLSQHLSNALSLYVSHYIKQDKINNGGRKLLSPENGFPGWVAVSDRKLLETPVDEIKAHAVVAKDGSGTHKTIAEAIEMAAAASSDGGSGGGGRDVIYVKAGTYHENINIPTKRKNVMLVGDGKDKTVIIASRNGDNGWSTFQSATVG